MPKKLTQKEFEQRVFNCVGDKFSVISEYKGKNKPIELMCNIHNQKFIVNAECFMRGSQDIRGNCPICIQERQKDKFEQNRTEVICVYCKKPFLKLTSRLVYSKSGLFFCCREHKDLAQKATSGLEFEAMRPDHYGANNGISSYRSRAFNNYPHKCSICGWDEDEDILQVHHIDENRNNCELDNLIILCPTCHWKITMHKYKLVNRTTLVKIN